MGDNVVMTELDDAYAKGFSDGHTAGRQELEAQNKALWELVEIGEQLRDMVESLEHYCGDSVDLVRAMRRKDTWDAAIQKAEADK